MMYRVNELYFVEGDKSWAIACTPADPQIRPKPGDILVAGSRRWKVVDATDAPNGQVGMRLEDNGVRVTRGLILRAQGSPLSPQEFHADAVLLVRLSRALRAIDFEAFLDALHSTVVAGGMTETVRALGKNAIFAQQLVENGADDGTLDKAAAELGLEGEV